MPSRNGSSLRLLGLAAALAISILAVQPGHADLIVTCDSSSNTIYYSDASHSTVVGSCTGSCCDGCHCTGTTSPYATTQRFDCPDVICPENS